MIWAKMLTQQIEFLNRSAVASPLIPHCHPLERPPRTDGSSGLGGKKSKTGLPDIVKAGGPALHEPAREIDRNEVGSERIQKIIDYMVKIMRRAPQIGIPLRISHACSAGDFRGFCCHAIFNSVDGFRDVVTRTFRTVDNLDLPLADGCPKLGASIMNCMKMGKLLLCRVTFET